MSSRLIEVTEALLEKNDERAAANRELFRRHGVLALNIVSSPGSGKTEFIVRTLKDLHGELRFGVIVGDCETDNDARRLRVTSAPVTQITTGGYCHLEAGMIARAAEGLDVAALDILIIENVGNLVCPASYDLGEDVRIAMLSVTEGEDKPLKYPVIFRSANVVIVTKMDIAEAVGYDADTARANLAKAAPAALRFETSARSGAGMDVWYDWLRARVQTVR
ncbi:MAG TPA: hydrogenase nickel incorporation protein HypB [Armatimonadota bacterium]|jgi:hydrogenase nickel incorporation protein HypB